MLLEAPHCGKSSLTVFACASVCLIQCSSSSWPCRFTACFKNKGFDFQLFQGRTFQIQAAKCLEKRLNNKAFVFEFTRPEIEVYPRRRFAMPFGTNFTSLITSDAEMAFPNPNAFKDRLHDFGPGKLQRNWLSTRKVGRWSATFVYAQTYAN
jgi:hypothetical protein